MFRSFRDAIPGVRSAVAGTDFNGRCKPYTLAAVLEIETREALLAYGSHPAHQRLVALLDELGCKRIVADFEQ